MAAETSIQGSTAISNVSAKCVSNYVRALVEISVTVCLRLWSSTNLRVANQHQLLIWALLDSTSDDALQTADTRGYGSNIDTLVAAVHDSGIWRALEDGSDAITKDIAEEALECGLTEDFVCASNRNDADGCQTVGWSSACNASKQDCCGA